MRRVKKTSTNLKLIIYYKKRGDLTLLLCQLLLLGPFDFGNASCGFGSEQATAPMPSEFVTAIVEVSFDCLHDLVEV